MYDTNKRIIKEIALEDIKLKIQASFFMLLSNVKMLKDKGCWNISYEKNKDIKIIEDKIFKCVSELDRFLQNNSNERDKQITDFIKLKNDFIIISESIYAYFYYNHYLKKIITNQLKLVAAKDNADKNINNNIVFNACLEFISESDIKKEKIPAVMSILPLKITREKYNDYIKDSLMIMTKNGNKNFVNCLIKNLKLKFLPNQVSNYGLYYPEIKDKLNAIDNMDIEELNYEQLFESYELLADNLEVFSELEDYLSTIYESINYIIYILTFSHDIDFIFEDNLIYKDIFYSCKNMLKDVLEQELKSNLDNLISDTCERLVDLIIDIEKSISQMLDKVKTNSLPEDILEILRINQIITDAYYETLSDAVYPLDLPEDSSDNLDHSFIEEKITSLLDYMNLSLETLTSNKRRLTKQFFLENLPTPFNLGSFKDYLNYILENTNNYEKVMLIEGLDNLLHENKYHNHNCDCGCSNN